MEGFMKVLLVMIFLTLWPYTLFSSEECMDCHSKKGTVIHFEDGSSMDATVDQEELRLSVHSNLQCRDCHRDKPEGRHPERRFKSREYFKIKTSHLCRTCHSPQEIKAKTIHEQLFMEEEKGIAHPCTNCHGSHGVMPVRKKLYRDEDIYCLSCHKESLRLRFRNGESLSIRVERSHLESSVHRNLGCSDCHFGFSSSSHPERHFKSRRDYTIASSEICRRCHFDKYVKTSESIHYTLLSMGRLEAPVCIDCHGFHSIQHMGREKILIARRCQRCHNSVYEIYIRSVHGKALIDEKNQDVPVCIDCHTAHDIKDPLTTDYRERIPEICSRCHSNPSIMNKYGLSTDVIRTYLTDFHGITLSIYRKQKEERLQPSKPMAVCTDCHGTHNISSMGIQKEVIKKNLLKKCKSCHQNASENFSDAWISHYGINSKRTPLLYILDKIYRVLLPLTIAGLAVQIVLHIWRYAVNR
jgi:predicted CXXCH cytochrome family protein